MTTQNISRLRRGFSGDTNDTIPYNQYLHGNKPTISVADYATMKAGSYEIGQLVKNESTQAVYRYNGSGEFTLFLGGGFPKTLTNSITFACTEARSIGFNASADGFVSDRGNIWVKDQGSALSSLPPAFTPITIAPYETTTDTLTGTISEIHASSDRGWSVNAELVFIDLSNAPNLREVYAEDSLLETIDFSGCTSLTEVNLSGNNLVEVKGLGDTELEDRYSHYTALDLSNNQLDSDALNEIYASLPQGAYGDGYSRTIIVTGNPGVGAGSGSNPALAVGWTVVGDIA